MIPAWFPVLLDREDSWSLSSPSPPLPPLHVNNILMQPLAKKGPSTSQKPCKGGTSSTNKEQELSRSTRLAQVHRARNSIKVSLRQTPVVTKGAMAFLLPQYFLSSNLLASWFLTYSHNPSWHSPLAKARGHSEIRVGRAHCSWDGRCREFSAHSGCAQSSSCDSSYSSSCEGTELVS